MAKDIHSLISKHKALQETAFHFNRINWMLHTIFIGLHGLLLSSFVRLLVEFDGKKQISPVMVCVCSALGLLAVLAWRSIYKRHQFFIKTMYDELHTTEDKIKIAMNEQENGEADYRVHLAIKEKDEQQGIKATDILRKTDTAITIIQSVAGVLYILFMLYYFQNVIRCLFLT